MPRHDHDAGGDPEILEAKAALRDEVWARLEKLDEPPRKASSIKGASRNARRLSVDDLKPVDLVVVGAVAVDRSGTRLGKGGGFSDLEYAVALEAGLTEASTPVVTTVHPHSPPSAASSRVCRKAGHPAERLILGIRNAPVLARARITRSGSSLADRHPTRESTMSRAGHLLGIGMILRGVVRVFVNFGSTDEIDPLPLTGPITAGTGDQVLDYNLKPDSLRIYMHNLTATDEDPGTFGSGNQFRYVIIPGGVALSGASALDLNDYGAVTTYFGIDP